MGGFGSGRRTGRSVTVDYRRLDVRALQRDGLLTPGMACGWQWTRNGEKVASIQVRALDGCIILNYRTRTDGGEWKPKEYPVYLEWTGLHFGGRRAWFRCPAQGCGRRVAILYSGSIFACRHCRKLAYQCQSETADDRATRRADTIRHRLGWEPGILNPEGWKPKGMHWRTFERLRAEHQARAHESLMGIARRLKMNFPGMD